MRLGILLLAALAFTLPRGAAAEETDRSHWLRLRFQLVDLHFPGVDEETTIFRDGLVVQRYVRFGEELMLRRGQATRAEIRKLRTTLAARKVEAQVGDCDLAPFGGQFVSIRLTVTWFGRKNQSNRFAVGSAFFATPCGSGTWTIIEEISNFVDAALQPSRREIEELEPEPSSPRLPCE